MRITVNIDDELFDHASRLTGIEGRTALVREGLRALIERESARRLAKLGGLSLISNTSRAAEVRPHDPGRHLRIDQPSAGQ